jgi:hypothetical protein
VAWAMAGPLGFSVAVFEVGIPSCAGGYVFLEVVPKILFIIARVIRPDASPAALTGDSGDLAWDKGDESVRWERAFDAAATRGVPYP